MRESQRHSLRALGIVRLEPTLSSLIAAAETGDGSAAIRRRSFQSLAVDRPDERRRERLVLRHAQ